VRRADVVVIGAGLAGLAAAHELVKAGRSVVVLEARDRVGGRVKNWRCGPDSSCDCGQIVGPRHSRIRAVAKELGIGLYGQNLKGNDVGYVNGSRVEISASSSRRLVPLAGPDAVLAFRQLDEMAKTVSPEAPWQAARAAEWDAMTVESWAQDQLVSSPGGRLLLRALVYGATAAEPGEWSLLHLLAYIASLGDGKSVDDVLDFLLLGDLVDGGLQQLPNRIAERLGRRVVLDAPVRRITHRRGRVRVESKPLTVVAKRAIVATAPSLNAGIEFAPPLPAPRAQLTQRFPQGSIATFVAVYERPFWRERGLSGRALGLEPAVITLDISPPDGSPWILASLIPSAPGRRHARLPAAERKRAVLENFATYFGDQALHPMMVLERDWSGAARDADWVDPKLGAQWTRGCPGFLPPGVLLDYGPAIRQPLGRIHWASTEHSPSWNTFHEGAVRSGEAAAKEILAAL
jgi:monoamine oxidase